MCDKLKVIKLFDASEVVVFLSKVLVVCMHAVWAFVFIMCICSCQKIKPSSSHTNLSLHHQWFLPMSTSDESEQIVCKI